jgi:hypothetical protein
VSRVPGRSLSALRRYRLVIHHREVSEKFAGQNCISGSVVVRPVVSPGRQPTAAVLVLAVVPPKDAWVGTFMQARGYCGVESS